MAKGYLPTKRRPCSFMFQEDVTLITSCCPLFLFLVAIAIPNKGADTEILCLSFVSRDAFIFYIILPPQQGQAIHLSVSRCLSGSQRELESIPAVTGRVTRTHTGRTCKLQMESHVWQVSLRWTGRLWADGPVRAC